MAKAPPKAIGSQKHGAWQALFAEPLTLRLTVLYRPISRDA
jgi:hypothetical protein